VTSMDTDTTRHQNAARGVQKKSRISRPVINYLIIRQLGVYAVVAAFCGSVFRALTFVPYPIADGSHPHHADATLGPSLISEFAALPTDRLLNTLFSSPQMVAQLVPTTIAITLTMIFGSPAGWNTAIVLMSTANYRAACKLAYVFGLPGVQCKLVGLSFALGPNLVVFIGGPTLSILLAPSIHLVAHMLAGSDRTKIKVFLLVSLSLMCSDVSAALTALTFLYLYINWFFTLAFKNSLNKVTALALVLASLSLVGLMGRALFPTIFMTRQWSDWLFYGVNIQNLWRPIAGSPSDIIARSLGYELADKGSLVTPWQHFSPVLLILVALIAMRLTKTSSRQRHEKQRPETSTTCQLRRLESLAYFIFACSVTPFGDSNSIFQLLSPAYWFWVCFPVMRYTGRTLPVVFLFALVVILIQAERANRSWLKRVAMCSATLLAVGNVVTTHLRVGAINYDSLEGLVESHADHRNIYVTSFELREETLKWLPSGSNFVGVTRDLQEELTFASVDFHRALSDYLDEGCDRLAIALSFDHWDHLLIHGLAEERKNCRGQAVQIRQNHDIIDLEFYERGDVHATETLAGFVAEVRSLTGLVPFEPFVTQRETEDSTQTFVINRLAEKNENADRQIVARVSLKGQTSGGSTDYLCLNATSRAVVDAGRLPFGNHTWRVPAGCEILRFLSFASGSKVSIDALLEFETEELRPAKHMVPHVTVEDSA